MAKEHLEALFKVMDQATSLLDGALHTTMIDALIEIGEDMHARDIQQEDGVPDAATTAKLKELFASVDLNSYSADEIRQALQLVMVKAAEHDQLEPNQQITPDALATLASFLISTMTPTMPETYRIGDIAAGSGNLLYAVMNQLTAARKTQVHGYAVDNNENLLALASMSAALQDINVDLYHQDAIDNLPFKDLDAIVSDLPVGYYPIDERAKGFETAAKSGHSYAHHLLMEQGLRALRPGGLGLFFVPTEVFKSEESKGLTTWLAQNAHFQGLLGMPTDFFSSKAAEKSLLLLQKPGAGSKQATQVLLGQFPDLSDRKAFQEFITDVRTWYQQNIN